MGENERSRGVSKNENRKEILTFQVIVAIICGIAVGAIWPSVGQEMKPIGETFINMIKMVIAPIIFLTIVLGIASMGSMKR